MGIPTLTWSTPTNTTNNPGQVLYNNSYVYDSSGPNPAPGVPVDNYQKTRIYNYNPGSGTEGNPGYVAPYYTTGYTSTNPHHNNMIVIKGGVYEKAEFISSTAGASSKPTTGTHYGNNVVFIDTGSTSPLSYGPIVPYSTVQGTQAAPAGSGLGSNIESNVGWTASTISATAGFHTNNMITTNQNTGPDYPNIPFFENVTDYGGSSDPGTGTATMPGISAVSGPNFTISYARTYPGPAGADYDFHVTFTGGSGTKRVEMWAPGLTPTGTAQPLKGRVNFEITEDKIYHITPLEPLTVSGTANIQPFGVGGGRTGNNVDINIATHSKVTVTTATNHGLADANNRIYVTGASQVQMNGWHYVYDVTNATTFSYVVPLSLSSSSAQAVSGSFTIETYDGIDKPGGVLKNTLNVEYVNDVKEFGTQLQWHANGDFYYVHTHNYYYRYRTTEKHGLEAGDSFSVSGTDAWSGDKTVARRSGDVLVDALYSSGGTAGTNSETRIFTGSRSMSGPIHATIRAGGVAGNNLVTLSYDASFSPGESYQFYPNSSYGNSIYSVTIHGMVENDASLFKKAGLTIDTSTGVLSSNGAYDGVNNKGIRSLDSFYPKFLHSRNQALNSIVTTGSITQSNNSIRFNNLERLPTGHLKTIRYANGMTTAITGQLSFTLDTDEDSESPTFGEVLNYSNFEIESANTKTTGRAGATVENDIGEDNTISENDYTLTYVNNSFPVANTSAFFTIQKQNNTPVISGTDIVAFVGPDEQFHVPIWGEIKAYKNSADFGSGHSSDANDYAYQEFCIKVYKNMNADRDDAIAIYSDPKNMAEPVDANTAFTYTASSVVTGQHEEDVIHEDSGDVVIAAGSDITEDLDLPITNTQHLANNYANGNFSYF